MSDAEETRDLPGETQEGVCENDIDTDVFHRAHKPFLEYPEKIKPEEISGIMARISTKRVTKTDKSVILTVTLANGFEMTEVGACLNPADFDMNRGLAVALDRIKDRLWMLEGYHRAASIMAP